MSDTFELHPQFSHVTRHEVAVRNSENIPVNQATEPSPPEGNVTLISKYVEKRHAAEKIPSATAPDDAWKADCETLSKMDLRRRYSREATCHRNMQSRSKARGAVVSPVFRDFRSFLKIMGPMPVAGATVDRIDNSDPEYAPGKVRWADKRTQNSNKGDSLYVRMRGRPKIRIREPFGLPAFLQAYDAALKSLQEVSCEKSPKTVRPTPGTLGWLAREYEKSFEFKRLDPRSQRVRRAILEACLAEPTKPGSPHKFGECPLDRLEPKHVKIMRDRKLELPGAANNRVRALRVMLAWGVEAEHAKRNVAAEVKPLKYKKQEFHTWTIEEVQLFEERHHLGSRARLALAVMLFTGVRRSDAVQLGPDHIKDGWLVFTPQKTSGTTGMALQLPILPELQEVLDATPLGKTTFLATNQGRPFTSNGFGNWFRDRCDEAGLGHCTAHGLRKAGATVAAENGAFEKQLMAIFGWETAKLASHYSKTADQKKLAGNAMHLIVPKAGSRRSVPPESNQGVPPHKNVAK
jgi:integrase